MKRKPRGKAKPIPIEAKRVALFHSRLQRGERHIYIGDWKGRRLIPAERWVAEQFKASDAETLYHVSRALRRSESEAKRVIRDNWSEWNAKGLQWGERQQGMAKLGFPNYGKMPRTTFGSFCRRMGLNYAPVK
jgi:hypothetical protein